MTPSGVATPPHPGEGTERLAVPEGQAAAHRVLVGRHHPPADDVAAAGQTRRQADLHVGVDDLGLQRSSRAGDVVEPEALGLDGDLLVEDQPDVGVGRVDDRTVDGRGADQLGVRRGALRGSDPDDEDRRDPDGYQQQSSYPGHGGYGAASMGLGHTGSR